MTSKDKDKQISRNTETTSIMQPKWIRFSIVCQC